MELIVTEKPKVANKIAYILSNGNAKRKSNKGVSYYEFEIEGKKIVVAPAVGHIFSLTEKEKSYNYPVFDIEWVPNFKVSKSAYYTRAYYELLESLSMEAENFISACDYDIEGSLIAGNIFKFVYKKKNAQRMKFSSLTTGDILNAYKEREDLDYGNINAGEARHILDWYYGINLSRALMSALKSAKGFRIMSIGRVQGPALELLAALERKIKSFIPEPYWELYILIREIKFFHKKNRFKDEALAKKSLENTSESASIEKVEKTIQEMWPLPPFDLTSLQVDAYRIFKFSPSKTLQLAQGLYENSLISYPRTSSQKLPAKLGLPKIIEKLTKNGLYSKHADKILQNKWFSPFQGRKEDSAHPAIHPTGLSGEMTKDEEKLYDLIVKRFLCCFGPKAKKENIKVHAISNNEQYLCEGSRLIEKGWIEFYEPYYYGKDVLLPEFIEGRSETIDEKKKTKKETEPPRRYTAASILSELEKKGLGTKATRALILDKLYEREYIVGSSIEVTQFGLEVERILKKYADKILDEELTRKIEDEMELITENKKDSKEVIGEGKKILEEILLNWKKSEITIGNELLEALELTEQTHSVIGKCSKCGLNLKIIKMKFGKQFIGCQGYPACSNAYPLPTSALIKPTGKECKHCQKPTVWVIKGRKKYSLCIDPNCIGKNRVKKSEKDK